MAVGGISVAVGGTDVAVGGIGVAVGGTGVAVGSGVLPMKVCPELTEPGELVLGPVQL